MESRMCLYTALTYLFVFFFFSGRLDQLEVFSLARLPLVRSRPAAPVIRSRPFAI